ncbi:MAG: PKD domain-containing protein, partial [Bacteroidetes bacterium]
LNPTVFNCYATQAVTYLWDFGSNPPTSISSTTSSSPTVTFATAGTYNYTLTLTNECGSNTFFSSIIVNPAVQISASGPSATCLNTDIPLTGSITGGATTGTWTASITGGTFLPSITALSPTYTPPTNYTGTITFTLTSDDPIGPCPAKTISFQVVVNAQATADAGTYNPICQNAFLQLNGIVGGAASSGSWTSSNGGTFSDATSLTSTYTPPPGFVGTIVLTLTTNDPPGPCNPEIDTVTISVIQTPTVNTLSNIVVCHNENIGPISFSGTTSTNYSWTNSNPAIGLGASGTSAISFVGTNTGNAPIMGIITVTPYNTIGSTSCPGNPITYTITINPQGQVNTVLGQVVCNGDTVTLANLSTTNTGGTT